MGCWWINQDFYGYILEEFQFLWPQNKWTLIGLELSSSVPIDSMDQKVGKGREIENSPLNLHWYGSLKWSEGFPTHIGELIR